MGLTSEPTSEAMMLRTWTVTPYSVSEALSLQLCSRPLLAPKGSSENKHGSLVLMFRWSTSNAYCCDSRHCWLVPFCGPFLSLWSSPWGLRPRESSLSARHPKLPLSSLFPQEWGDELSWFAQDSLHTTTESLLSLETPQSQATQTKLVTPQRRQPGMSPPYSAL